MPTRLLHLLRSGALDRLGALSDVRFAKRQPRYVPAGPKAKKNPVPLAALAFGCVLALRLLRQSG